MERRYLPGSLLAVNLADPIGVQLHALQMHRSRHGRASEGGRLTQAHLAAELDVATETIRRALGKAEVDRGVPVAVTFAVAHALDLRADYVAIAMARDEMRRRWTTLRPTQRRIIDRYRAIEVELDAALVRTPPYAGALDGDDEPTLTDGLEGIERRAG